MARREAPAGEEQLIDWLRARTGSALLGDDAAVLPRSEAWAVSVDSQIEGVHFPSGRDPDLIGRRLVAVNLSDLAAMGADPAYGLLALAAPADYPHRRLIEAVVAAGGDAGLELAGGDLAANDRVVATLTVLGSKPPARRWLRRGGASPEEAIWVGGPLGLAAAGLAMIDRGLADLDGALAGDLSLALQPIARRAVERQCRPRAQLALGRWLGTTTRGGAIDVSDGLARDLHRLCRESGVGAIVEWEALPIDRELPALAARLDRRLDEWVLAGGEDYVLLFTLPLAIDPPPELGAVRIGRTTNGSDVLLSRSGLIAPLPPAGFDHLRRGADPATR